MQFNPKALLVLIGFFVLLALALSSNGGGWFYLAQAVATVVILFWPRRIAARTQSVIRLRCEAAVYARLRLMAALHVISGMAGAGKTTLARQLASFNPGTVHLRGRMAGPPGTTYRDGR